MDEQRTQSHDLLVKVGQIVADRYEVVEHLGTGGFAKVYRAHDQRIERDVAIKFLDLRGMNVADQTINNILERFSREAKLAAKIPHRTVVNIFDIGQIENDPYRPFIVMELLHGLDLQEVLDGDGAMSPKRILPLFVDALDGLGKAHDMGIVHKDLKPSNLFLSDPKSRGETLRLVDFGIAHIKSGNTPEEEAQLQEAGQGRLTATGQILGTLQYMAPEYIGSQLVTPALDVYQMGLILVEMLSGQPVIKTSNAFECLRIHTFGLLELPSYLLNSDLASVLHKALHAEHDQRYPDATAFANALSVIEPDSIPFSPLLKGAKTLSTSQYQNVAGIPQGPTTDNHAQPTTGDYNAEDIGTANTLGPQDHVAGAIHHQTTEAELSIAHVPTMTHDVGATEGALHNPTQHNQRIPDEPTPKQAANAPDEPTSSGPSTGLKVGMGVLFLAIFAALATIGVIISNGDKATTDPDPKTIATRTQPKETPKVTPKTTPKVTPKETIPSPITTPPIAENKTKVVPKDTTPPTPIKKTKKTKRPTIEVFVFPSNAKTLIINDVQVGSFKYTFKKRQKSVRATVSAPNYRSKQIVLSSKKSTMSVSLTPKTNLADNPALNALKEQEKAKARAIAKANAQAEKERLEREAKKRELDAALAKKKAQEEEARKIAAAKKEAAAKKAAEAKKQNPEIID